MISGQIDAEALEGLNEMLRHYAEVSKSSEDTILAKKGNDLRIQLYRQFRRARWKGGKSIAHREMVRRRKAGRGTLVRPATIAKAGPAPAGMNKRQWLVAQEIKRRQAGIGVLSVGFLLRRWRSWRGGRRLAANRTQAAVSVVTEHSREFGLISSIEQHPGSFRLRGFVPGQDVVSERYGLMAAAMHAVTADMAPYVARKHMEAAGEVFKRGAKI